MVQLPSFVAERDDGVSAPCRLTQDHGSRRVILFVSTLHSQRVKFDTDVGSYKRPLFLTRGFSCSTQP